MEAVKPRATSAREVPERDPAFADVSLEDLRHLRQTLQTEETRVSYWRRLVQARLDVLEAATGKAGVSDRVQRLRQVLSPKGPSPSRMGHVDVFPSDDTPPLPDLGELWSRELPDDDDEGLHQLRQDLGIAELQLSTYRAELHRRLGAATDELVARYHGEPGLCLSILPLER